jgi:predicted amidophosphoribosyltransferase
MNINPIKLVGLWDEGYALDIHTISSEFTGYNEYGYPEFKSEYSHMGQLLYLFKNKGIYDKLTEIMELAMPFIQSWEILNTVRTVMPVPPTNKQRIYQPAEEIAFKIAEIISANYIQDVLEKTSSTQSKGLAAAEKKKIKNTIIKSKMAKNKHNMLLVDDLFESGATLSECVKALRQDPNIDKIYVLTMTKTRKG